MGAVMAEHVKGGLRQRQEPVIAKGAAEAHLAQFAHRPHALAAQALVSPVATQGGNHLVPGGDQFADKPIAGERAGTGEQDTHRGRSMPQSPPAPCGGLTCAYITGACDKVNCGIAVHENLTSRIRPTGEDRADWRPSVEFPCHSAADGVLFRCRQARPYRCQVSDRQHVFDVERAALGAEKRSFPAGSGMPEGQPVARPRRDARRVQLGVCRHHLSLSPSHSDIFLTMRPQLKSRS